MRDQADSNRKQYLATPTSTNSSLTSCGGYSYTIPRSESRPRKLCNTRGSRSRLWTTAQKRIRSVWNEKRRPGAKKKSAGTSENSATGKTRSGTDSKHDSRTHERTSSHRARVVCTDEHGLRHCHTLDACVSSSRPTRRLSLPIYCIYDSDVTHCGLRSYFTPWVGGV
jgi:hypothetical protein